MIEVERVPGGAGRVTVVTSGQVDLATAPQLAKAIAEAWEDGVTEVAVDLSEVDFLDSAGVRVLVHAGREAAEAGARLYVDGARGWVARVLEITGVAEYLQAPPPAAPDGAVSPSDHV